MSTVLLPMKLFAGLLPPPAGAGAAGEAGGADVGWLLLVAWLVGTLPPGVAGVVGLAGKVGAALLPELPVFPVPLMLPAGTSCHCWFAPFQSWYWAIWPPSALEPSGTSTALPLKVLIRRT